VIEIPKYDRDYLRWLAEHRNGYVVNCYKPPKPTYLMLHIATCYTINGTPARGKTWVEGGFDKMCSESVVELRHWAENTVGGPLHPCGTCRPLSGVSPSPRSAQRR
jgi:hypothetical protein